MREVYRYDDNGFYVEPVFVQQGEAMPLNTTDVRPTDGMFQAKWNGIEWLENLLPDEIKKRLEDKNEPDEIEILQKNQSDLIMTLMMSGVI